MVSGIAVGRINAEGRGRSLTIDFLNKGNQHHVGLIPENLIRFANPEDDAVKQLADSYVYGGNQWHDIDGFKLGADNSLKFPGDPKLLPRAQFVLGPKQELVVVYDSAFIAVIQADRTFRVTRMD